MLNDIRLHLDADEDRQRQAEHKLATTIHALRDKNIAAFNHYVPSVGQIIPQLPFDRLSVFVDKDDAVNIVDFQSGISLYGVNVDANIQTQASAWAYNSALLDAVSPDAGIQMQANNAGKFDLASRQNYAKQVQAKCQQSPIDTLVLLGLGKASHLSQLLNKRFSSQGENDVDANTVKRNASDTTELNTSGLKYLVIYEPDWEIFRCSLSVFDWASFLEKAAQVQLQIFFRIGSDIAQMFDEITELNQALGARDMLFYKHINLPIFMQVVAAIQQGKWGRSAVQIQANQKGHQFHHLNVFSASPASSYSATREQTELFKSNMALFAEYFPDIHASFESYTPRCWETVYNAKADVINMLNTEHGSFYSSTQPRIEAQALSEHFIHYPNLDGLVFGYAGDKLRHYLHNTFIRQADMLLRENEEQQGELPSDVKALMVFGLGNGYMLESLNKKHHIQNLIICEPNPDFFYAALHAIDWSPIFAQVNEGEYKLYINIGEASSRLFKDLMSQFLALGPHLLNETFIMQAYHNPMLHQVMSEVRQQLQVIFAMGENFDHVAYGIAHTIRALQNKVPALRFNPSQYLGHAHKQTPVFFIGNGPSLDKSIDLIKEHRERVIVVSCGTALQALYKNGITPDFHGEVEQNRANFDWASRINDRAYLKKITLLSVNGIHPDTSSLYKNVLIAFKSGESSSHAILAMFPPDSFHCLDHAYPTVTNMAMSFFLSLGFEQLYLIGVDLGFADQSKHHSSASGYYENGKQIYDYKSVHAADMRVKGNRQDWVFTKTEFNISRMIIEQLLQDINPTKARVECFNLSDGVFIEGTLPLDPNDVLVMTDAQQKHSTILAFEDCFMSLHSDLNAMLAKAYQNKLLSKQFASLKILSDTPLHTKTDVVSLIDEFSALLMAAKRKGKSLFFYYFFNSINYLNAALSKATLQSDETLALQASQRLLKNWRVFLHDAQDMLSKQFSLIDTAEAFGEKREAFLIATCPIVSCVCADNDTFVRINRYLERTPNKAISLHKDLYSLDSIFHEGPASSPLVIIVSDYEDAANYVAIINASHQLNGHKHAIALLFNCFESLEEFAVKQEEAAKSLCLMYCPGLLNQANIEDVYKGLDAVFSDEEFCHFVQSRGQDIGKYSLIIAKPRFSHSGLDNVRFYNETKASMKQEEGALYTSSMNKEINVKSTESSVHKNEYESLSVAVINHRIIQRIPAKANVYAYMFKQYIGYTKASNHENPSLTMLDTLENRGLLMKRPPFDFELLGQWHTEDKLKALIEL